MDTARAADPPGLSRMSVASPCTVPRPGTEPRSPALQADPLPSEPAGKILPLKTIDLKVSPWK